MRIGLFVLMIVAVNLVYGQDSISVIQQNLPNARYKRSSIQRSTTITKVYRKDEVSNEALYEDIRNDSVISVENRFTGAEMQDGQIPMKINFERLVYTPNQELYIPMDIVIHGKTKGLKIEIDSISTDSLNILWKFRMKQNMQHFYDQITVPTFTLAEGDTMTIDKQVNIPIRSADDQVIIQYSYYLKEIKKKKAHFEIMAFGMLEMEGMDDCTFTGDGMMIYDAHRRNIDVFEFEMIAKGSKIIGDELGKFTFTNSAIITSEYLGKNKK